MSDRAFPKHLHRSLSLALISFVVIAVSCVNRQAGRPNQSPQTSAKVRTISFGCQDLDLNFYRGLAEQFGQANPDLHVEVVSLTDKIAYSTANGDTGDSLWQELVTTVDTLVFSPDPEAMRPGLLRDLTPFVRSAPNFAEADFYPGILADLQWQDGLWGIPLAAEQLYVIYYDKAMFDQMKLPYPQPGWTWEEFLNTAKTLTITEGASTTRWGYVEAMWNPLPFLQGRSGKLIDNAAGAPTAILQSQSLQDAVQWYVDLALTHHIMPIPQLEPGKNPFETQAARLISSGQAAMWSGGTIFWERWSAGRQLGLAPFPVDGPDSTTTPLAVSAGMMSAYTAHPDASWRWLDFLSHQAPSRGTPARRAVAQASSSWSQLPDEQARVIRYGLEHGLPMAQEFAWTGDALYAALATVFARAQNAQSALLAAQQAIAQKLGSASPVKLPQDVALAVATPAPASDSATQSIRFISGLLDWRADTTYRHLAETFERDQPGIKVETISFASVFGSGSVGKSQSEIVHYLTSQADCFVMPWVSVSGDQLTDLLPLDPLIENDPVFPHADFYPLALRVLQVGNQTWALPQTIYPRMIFYHQALFDRAGIAYPKAGWNFDDFLALSVTLTQEQVDEKQYGYLPYPDLMSDATSWVEQYGASLIDVATLPIQYRFDDPKTIEAVRWYVTLRKTHDAAPLPSQPRGNIEQWYSEIQLKRGAMWSQIPVLMSPRTPFGPEVRAVPMPIGNNGATDFMLTAYHISRRTPSPRVCWEWIKFLTAQPAIYLPYDNVQTGVPARLSVAGSPVYARQIGAERAENYQAAMSQSKRLSSLSLVLTQPQLAHPLQWFGQAVEKAMNGAMADEALAAAQAKADAYVHCLATRSGLAEGELIAACLKQVDPTFSLPAQP